MVEYSPMRMVMIGQDRMIICHRMYNVPDVVKERSNGTKTAR